MLNKLHLQYITDTTGKCLVILLQEEFDMLLEELSELQDINSYDEAKRNDTGERIPMQDVFKMIEEKRKSE